MNQNWLYEKWKLIPLRSKIGRVLFYLFTTWLAYVGIKNTIRDSSLSIALFLLICILFFYFLFRKKWHDYRRIPPKLWNGDWLYEKWTLIPMQSKVWRLLYFALCIYMGIKGVIDLTLDKKNTFLLILLAGQILGYFIRRDTWKSNRPKT